MPRNEEEAIRAAIDAAEPVVEIADARPPEFSDEALAQRFVARQALR